MAPDRAGVYRIEFRVPRGVTLDRQCVLKAMSEALAEDRWIESEG